MSPNKCEAEKRRLRSEIEKLRDAIRRTKDDNAKIDALLRELRSAECQLSRL